MKLKKRLKKLSKSLVEKYQLKVTLKSPKVIIMEDGGFCSVIGKYLLGQNIQKQTRLPVAYDLTWFKESSMDFDGRHHRKFQLLNVFPHNKAVKTLGSSEGHAQ